MVISILKSRAYKRKYQSETIDVIISNIGRKHFYDVFLQDMAKQTHFAIKRYDYW
jgi:hypothetical protein